LWVGKGSVDMPFDLQGLFNFSNSALMTLVPTIGAAYAFQIAVSIPAIILQEDRFYGASPIPLRLFSLYRFVRFFDVFGMHCVISVFSCPERTVFGSKPGSVDTSVSENNDASSSSNPFDESDHSLDDSTWYPSLRVIRLI
jgi:hypothetical protein